jgi:hypothetical protein
VAGHPRDPRYGVRHPRLGPRSHPHPTGPLRPVIPEADAAWSLIGSFGHLAADADRPGRAARAHRRPDAESGAVTELVAERSDTLETGTVAGGRLVLSWLRDASSRLTLHRLDGAEIGEMTLPGLGSVRRPRGAGGRVARACRVSPRSGRRRACSPSMSSPASFHGIQSGRGAERGPCRRAGAGDQQGRHRDPGLPAAPARRARRDRPAPRLAVRLRRSSHPTNRRRSSPPGSASPPPVEWSPLRAARWR